MENASGFAHESEEVPLCLLKAALDTQSSSLKKRDTHEQISTSSNLCCFAFILYFVEETFLPSCKTDFTKAVTQLSICFRY